MTRDLDINGIDGIDQSEEISSLITALHEISERLQDLTVGEVDTVADSEGRTFMLRHAQDNMRHIKEDRQAAILDALAPQIALLDPNGRVVSVNAAWRRFRRENALASADGGLGLNYLTACDHAGSAAQASQVAAGLRAVLTGDTKTFSIEYAYHSPTEQRWFRLTATPLSTDRQAGAVVMHTDITDRKHDEAALLRFRAAMDATADAIYLVDRDSMRFVHVNDAACGMQELSREALLAMAPSDLLRTPSSVLERVYDDLIAGGTPAPPLEILRVRKNGATAWVELRRHAMRSVDSWTIVTLVRDITERKAKDDRIRRLSRMEAMSSRINELIVRVLDRDTLFDGACRIAVEAGAFSCAWIGSIDVRSGIGGVVASHGVDTLAREAMVLATSPAATGGQHPASRSLRESRPMICNDLATDPAMLGVCDALLASDLRSAGYFPLMLAGQPTAVLALFSGESGVFDAAETQLLAELTSNLSFALDHIEKAGKLRYLAYYDELTGLANRRLFLERVAQCLHTAVRTKHQVGVFLIDLERFKNINHSLGQEAGDELLRQVAQWLIARMGGATLMARIGADQFAVVVPEVRSTAGIERLLSRKMTAFLNHSFRLNDRLFRVAFKVGVAMFPGDGNDADLLFKNAEAALKKAKSSGERYLHYTQTMTDGVAGNVTLENELRRALERHEFVLHYQPKVDLATGRLTGAEALIRWNDPRTGLVPPGRFIPILEETGLIHDVGRWALHQALADHLRWRAAGLASVRIAVNVSPLQLRSRSFIAEIQSAIGIDRHAAEGLEIEITESMVMGDVNHSIATLESIRGMGVKIAIDDFGTGFSSLSYLSKLPIDTLKIDRSFIIDMTSGPSGLALVSTIVNLAHSLRLNVVAEGVETEEQRGLLRELNCDQMQGFLFSRPIPCEEFESRYLRPAGQD